MGGKGLHTLCFLQSHVLKYSIQNLPYVVFGIIKTVIFTVYRVYWIYSIWPDVVEWGQLCCISGAGSCVTSWGRSGRT
jgi:hypothetical protein